MSANLDLVRSICADWERGSYARTDWADPEIEFVLADGPEPGRWTGIAEMVNAWRESLAAFEDVRLSYDDFRELGGEQVLVRTRSLGRGRASGLPLERVRTDEATIFTVHGDRVTRLSLYWNYQRALADLGLGE